MKIGRVISVVVLDQLTKYIVSHNLKLNQVVYISDFFNITFIKNKGVLFGMTSSFLSPFLIIAVNLIAITILVLWSLRPDNNIFLKIGLDLTIAGAVGNLIDRLLYGGVVDFLDFHIGKYHWPTYNVADVSITLSVIGLLILSFFQKKENNESQKV